MKIGFIGLGNMGGAILKGFLSKGSFDAQNIFIYDKDKEKVESFNRRFGVQESDGIEGLVEKSSIIILGVKPNSFEDLLPEVKEAYSNNKIIISMAAGISISYIESFLGSDSKIIRIMPNTPAFVNEAMTSVSRNKNVSDDELKRCFAIFNAIGTAREIEEELIHSVIGVSGSSPAYTYMYIKALAEAAALNGMKEEDAILFAAQSVYGAAKMILETSETPDTLIKNVCSPGGTTIEAVLKLKENGFIDNVKEGFQAAVDKSKIMEKK